jgi:hypothetical protein
VILGQTTVGVTDDTANQNAKVVQSLVVPAGAGRVVAAYGLFRFTASGSQPFRVVLYDDSAGAPNNLLGNSDDVTISSGGALASAYYLFSFSTPVDLAARAGTTIWDGYHAGTVTGTQPIMMDTAGSFKFQAAAADLFTDGASATFGATSSFAANVCMYLVTADHQLLGTGVGS